MAEESQPMEDSQWMEAFNNDGAVISPKTGIKSDIIDSSVSDSDEWYERAAVLLPMANQGSSSNAMPAVVAKSGQTSTAKANEA
jgi:hypothetical protein